MVGTSTLHRLTALADRHDWRVVLVGDPQQLQAVGRGGMFAELCANGRVDELATVHRFTHDWERAASLRLRHGDTTVFDTYEQHRRVSPGSLDTHLERLTRDWCRHDRRGRTVAITATTNEHVDAINHAIQHARYVSGELDVRRVVTLADDEPASVGARVVSRRSDRALGVRNRDLWTINALHRNGAITVATVDGGRSVRLPEEYVREHVRLGYAATEHGNQGVTVGVAYHLVTPTTTSRGLDVGATRGRDANQLLVMTDTNDPADARDILDRVLTFDRADLPATAQRRHLLAVQPPAPVLEPPPTWGHEPAWLAGWRHALSERRVELLERCAERDKRRDRAVADLDALPPELAAARAAWQPYEDRIKGVELRLTRELRPAVYKAANEQRSAEFGHRRRADRTLGDAKTAVESAQVELHAIHSDGLDTRSHLDHLASWAERTSRRASS